MKEFIAVLKYCRQKEIKEYKDKNYEISNNFKCYRKFYVNFKGVDYKFGVACEFLEVKFYLIKKDSDGIGETPYYYSILEIVNLLLYKNNKNIINKLLKTKRNEVQKIIFDGSEYKFNFYNLKKYEKYLDDETIQLIILLCIIQDKSNIYFSKKNQYHEGIIRLIDVLIARKERHKLLLDMGWRFSDGKFILTRPNYLNAIIIVFKTGDIEKKTEFQKRINSDIDSCDLLSLFINTYNEINDVKIPEEDIFNNDILKINLDILKKDSKKLFNVITRLKDYENEYKKSYTVKPVYIGTNIHFILRLSSPEKNKYYLTKQQKIDIMKG